MSLVIGGSPNNWYIHSAQFSIFMLQAYVRTIERSAAHTEKDFQAGKDTYFPEPSEDELLSSPVELYDGLDSETWALDDLYKEYFPNVQRWGALSTLFSFLERTLDELCELFIRDMRLTVSLSDIRGNGCERAFLFLSKIVGLHLDPNGETWREIRTIQKIRNLIVHANGKFREGNAAREREVSQYVEASKLVAYKDEIVLFDGFLDHTVELFHKFFRSLDHLIRIRQST